jgi:DNA-directed RNA polymerase subunit E'/Rpb7
MDNIYFNCVLTKKIIVESKFLNENVNEYIENYLKKKVEGICIDEGYVKEGTVKIIKKSVGKLLGSRFTGDITYEVAYTANVCNPVVGNVIDCKVKFVNKLGILGNNGPITIIIGKQFHSNENSLNKISENDVVKVEVIAKKYSLNDKEIKIIAKLWYENETNESKKQIKKDLISSDLTPILQDNDFMETDNQEDFDNNSEDIEQYSIDDEMDDEMDDDIIYSDEDEEEENIKVENPDDTNLEIEDIELDDEEDEEDDDDLESNNEYD